jgi:putative transposase
MPWAFERFQQSGQTHFVTFSCYHRQLFFNPDPIKRGFELALERVRHTFKLRVYAYVIMPEHVHLLLSEPQRSLLADAIKSLKQGVSRRAIATVESADTETKGHIQAKRRLEWGTDGTVRALPTQTSPHHFWQKRYYDFNVRNCGQFLERINYTHQNPVRRGLCKRAEDWPWSSFLQYATGGEGRVQIECEWTARRRERAAGTLCPAVELPHSSQKRA